MSWNQNKVTLRLGIDFPIFQAPMAGGITTAELVSETSNNGGLGNLGAGYLEPEEIKDEIDKIKGRTEKPFGVNLFVPNKENPIKTDSIVEVEKALSKYRNILKLEEQPVYKEKDYGKLFTEQIEEVLKAKVPVCSFTFGIPDERIVKELKSNGSVVIGTATNVLEAIELEESGIELIVAQGSEAGGHRGTFHAEENGLIGLMALIPQIADQVRVPIIAAGGIMDARGIAASLVLGAEAVQLGTAFLCCLESGAHPIYKETLLQATEDQTRLTKAFSGKLARGINNRFIADLDALKDMILPYPYQNDITSKLRKKAAELNNNDFMSLWAGQGIRLAKETSVKSLMKELVEEVQRIIY